MKLLMGLLFLSILSGCATSEYKPLPSVPPVPTALSTKQGVYHKVARGQTLWYIAQSYGVRLQDIIDSNNIPNAGAIEANQLIFIPGAKQVKDMATYTPDNNKNEFVWPLKGRILVYFHDPLGSSAFAHGIDIQAHIGEPVVATREGDVIAAGYMSGYGKTVMIDHRDGFISVYAHNIKLLVSVGDHVRKGEPVAQVGPMGSGLFEHFEIRRHNQATNPLYYLP